ncbi:MAG: hypothetical protein MR630_03345 [Selenomonas sp.]|uniref:hypothetical protein n=1 Tax=Selenomonas sp. TaxID=2053611 RepID=UPI002600C01B|nr:hypothetical protein [Selenomonas sp.]MCI6100474.1 hypothetical protein [Selenomonas sp.]MCI6231638.1 hypothetical protein [Selenomonas sp.]
MTEQEFLTKMKEDILDTEEEITMQTQLGNIEEWDSLAFVSFLAMAKLTTEKKIEKTSIQSAQTVQELYSLLS